MVQLASFLAQKGYDVHVFAGSHDCARTEQGGFRVHRVLCDDPVDFQVKVVPAFILENDILPFDLMESAEIHGSAIGIKKKFPALPMVVRIHAPNFLVESLKKKYIPFKNKLRYLLGALRRFKWDPGYWKKYNKDEDPDYQFTLLADYISAPSEAMKGWTMKNWKIPGRDITVIPNLFSPSGRLLENPISKDLSSKRVLFFGRLNVLKGMVNAAIAMRSVLLDYPEWHFRIVGDDGPGPYPGVTMKQWMTVQLQPVIHRVEFIDGLPYDQLQEMITDCDIVLLPSLFESFSYTCAEAMAAGKAIVGSRNGAMTDLLEGGECGILVDPENKKEIRGAVCRLIEKPDLRHDLSLNARRRVVKTYNTTVLGGEYDAFYKQVCRRVK